jgi:hypothetical protein
MKMGPVALGSAQNDLGGAKLKTGPSALDTAENESGEHKT